MRNHVLIFVPPCLLIQVKAQAVFSFMANRKIWEYEVASLRGTIQVCHSGNRHASQDGNWRCSSMLNTTSSNWTSSFQRRKEEEVGLIRKGYVLCRFTIPSIVDSQFDNRWWINRSSIRRCFQMLVKYHMRHVHCTHTWHQNRMLWHVRAAG